VLRGRVSAKIDDKGRLKVPSAYRAFIEAEWGTGLYLTSLSSSGDCVRVYPMKVWEGIEASLREQPSLSPSRKAFEMTTSYWGQAAELDSQGRVVLPPQLREAAGASADVEVLGLQNCLEIWNSERLRLKVESSGLTDEHLATLGI
jgi:MraZ protein